MFEWIASPEAWVALSNLTALDLLNGGRDAEYPYAEETSQGCDFARSEIKHAVTTMLTCGDAAYKSFAEMLWISYSREVDGLAHDSLPFNEFGFLMCQSPLRIILP